jgi:predicted transcriptional regulator
MLKSPVKTVENIDMPTSDVKQQAHELIDSMDDTATWDEVAYRMEVRASIEQGLADVKAGRVHTHEEVRKHFGLDD